MILVDGLTQIDNAKEFYEEAFEFIKWSIGITVAVVAIVMPIVLQLLQNKNFNKNEKLLRAEVEKFKKELKEEINKENDKKINERTEELIKIIDPVIADLRLQIQFEYHENDASIAKVNGNHSLALKYYVLVVIAAIKLKRWEKVVEITKNIEEYSNTSYSINLKDNHFLEGKENRIEYSLRKFIILLVIIMQLKYILII